MDNACCLVVASDLFGFLDRMSEEMDVEVADVDTGCRVFVVGEVVCIVVGKDIVVEVEEVVEVEVESKVFVALGVAKFVVSISFLFLSLSLFPYLIFG